MFIALHVVPFESLPQDGAAKGASFMAIGVRYSHYIRNWVYVVIKPVIY
jgi:hypothetical protein